ncbi:hypothetical protein CLV51_103628 [Chitinophaga niastensis]|uniref:Uncharacterized protein n=1 Tax=Chitinophaga niastensis TaxID=536980 RepID=A0A2P8HKA2_CHINA|nr:hypothetical protein [Chitinophaga niastensis]PSL46647.1 hypothetical protein CLV51_103628 [Chitinophaga niastensis]
MNSINDPASQKTNKPADDDGPSWGGVIVGLLLGFAGVALIFYRYNQFHSIGDENISITKIEMLIYKTTGKSLWALIAAYALVSVVGFYLAVSNYTKLTAK